MTWMSRSSAFGLRGTRPKVPEIGTSTASSPLWRGSCFSLVMLLPFITSTAGCLDFRPVPWREPNASPQQRSVYPDADTTVSLTAQGAQAVGVIVEDEDTVTFIWSLSRDGYVGTATPIPASERAQGSQIKLAYDPELDGQTLTCVVSDGLSEDLTFRWQLEVL